ncbi:MAG: PilZ domain-containing protein [Gammaproteobacteria bacterium]
MRHYMRHPSDIPIEFRCAPAESTETRALHDVSRGGLSFVAPSPLLPDAVISVRIGCIEPAFEAPCRVTWCRRLPEGYLIGAEFLHAKDEYRARMVEQVCHIEHYKNQVQACEGRTLTSEQAAREWIGRYAEDFPELDDPAPPGR